jgi:hypothetical protein
MIRKAALVFVVFLLTATHVFSLEIGGVTMPDSMKAGNSELVLNGAGVRRKFGLKVYAVGLYLKAKNKNGTAVMNADEPMALQCRWRMGVPSRKVDEVFNESFSESLKIPKASDYTPQTAFGSVTKEVHQFVGYVDKRDVTKNDTWIFTYTPGKGTEVKINDGSKDTVMGVIPGLDFKKALFGIWISDHAPVGKSLVEDLMGK